MDLLKIILFLSLATIHLVSAKEVETNLLKNLKTIHLKNNLQSEKKLLYFWASWCPDCREKLRGDLRDLQKKNVDITTVNVDRRESKGIAFINEEKLPFPVIRDEDKVLRNKLSIFAVPSWAVLEKSGEKWKVLSSKNGSDMNEIKASLGFK